MGGGSGLADIALGIWFPISAYVMLDFEHCLANMFFFSCSYFSGGSKIVKLGPVMKNIVVSTIGNVVGAGILGGGLLANAMGNEQMLQEQLENQVGERPPPGRGRQSSPPCRPTALPASSPRSGGPLTAGGSTQAEARPTFHLPTGRSMT